MDILYYLKDLNNCWTDMVLLYSESSYKPLLENLQTKIFKYDYESDYFKLAQNRF